MEAEEEEEVEVEAENLVSEVFCRASEDSSEAAGEGSTVEEVSCFSGHFDNMELGT